MAKCYKHFFKVHFVQFSGRKLLGIHQTKGVFLVSKLMTRCLIIYGQLDVDSESHFGALGIIGLWVIMQCAVFPTL